VSRGLSATAELLVLLRHAGGRNSAGINKYIDARGFGHSSNRHWLIAYASSWTPVSTVRRVGLRVMCHARTNSSTVRCRVIDYRHISCFFAVTWPETRVCPTIQCSKPTTSAFLRVDFFGANSVSIPPYVSTQETHQ